MVKRVEVYCENGELRVVEYSSTIENGIEREVYNGYLQGTEAENYINTLANALTITRHFNLNSWCEYIHCSDGRVIQLFDSENIKSCGYLKEYFNQISKFDIEKKKRLASKVTRKNKHSGKRIIATGLVLLSLGLVTIYGTSVKTTKNEINPKPTISIEATAPTPTEAPLQNLWTEPTINTPTIEVKPIQPEFIPETTIPEVKEEESIEDSNYLYIEYNDRSNYEKVIKTRNLYGDLIQKYATMYGLDANLMIALATQERGIHSTEMDRGGATGLMQIQNSVWVGNSITAYNFETGQRETIKVTKERLADCETNIQIGCMIFQDMLRLNNYNILMALQSYNMGSGGVSIAVSSYAESIGCTRQDIVNDPNDCGWIYHRDLINFGDQKYIEHVLSYIGNDAHIEIYKPDGTLVVCNVRNYQAVKTR